ncbi:hypothetical protein BKH41_08605 [Helicobacter sp. 12S02232-10]|nr:hypothetical protein BKH41_08605 [Helicobacter sp. 12S02232-10]
MIAHPNFREISKKEKLFGITIKSWIICSFLGFSFFVFFVFYGLAIFGLSLIVVKILELIDDDIFDILYVNFSIKSKKFYA